MTIIKESLPKIAIVHMLQLMTKNWINSAKSGKSQHYPTCVDNVKYFNLKFSPVNERLSISVWILSENYKNISN